MTITIVVLSYLVTIHSNFRVFILIILLKTEEIYSVDLEQKAQARLSTQESKPLLISVCSTLRFTIYLMISLSLTYKIELTLTLENIIQQFLDSFTQYTKVV